MGGSTRQTQESRQNSTQTNAPPSWALPGLMDLAQRVTGLVGNLPGPSYTGDFVAQSNPLQHSAIPMYQNAATAAQRAGSMIGEAGQQLVQGGPQFGQWDTPRFDTSAAAQAASAPIMRNLTENLLPSLQSSALASGAFGNSRMMEILPSLAIRDAVRGSQEIGAQMALGEHEMAMNNQLQGYQALTGRGLGVEGLRQQALTALPGMMDASLQMQTAAGDITSQAGGMQQQWAQQGIDNALARHDYDLNQPWFGLDRGTALMGQLAGNYGTQTMNGTSSQTQTQRTGGLAPVLAGAMGLASMAAGFPGAGGALSSLFGRGGAAAAGAAGGGIPPGFGVPQGFGIPPGFGPPPLTSVPYFNPRQYGLPGR